MGWLREKEALEGGSSSAHSGFCCVSGSGGSLLFDDLPPASSGDSGSPTCQTSQGLKSDGKAAKRKTVEEEKNGSEELVEKKVCKGFQTV